MASPNHFCSHPSLTKLQPLYATLNTGNPVHIITFQFSNIHLNIIVPSDITLRLFLATQLCTFLVYSTPCPMCHSCSVTSYFQSENKGDIVITEKVANT